MIEIGGYPQFWGCPLPAPGADMRLHISFGGMRRCGQGNEVVLATIVTRMSNLGYLLSRFSRLSLFLVCAGFSAFVLVLCVLAGAQFKRSSESVFYRQTENIAQMLLAEAEILGKRLQARCYECDVAWKFGGSADGALG